MKATARRLTTLLAAGGQIRRVEALDDVARVSVLKRYAVAFMYLMLTAIASGTVYAHAVGFWGVHPLKWSNDQIGQVIPFGDAGQKISIEGKDCLSGGWLNFNVRDEYAFDIDETVWLDLELYAEPVGSKLSVIYDRNDVAPITTLGGAADARQELELPEGGNTRWHRQSIPLERARFANLGYAGSDFAVRGKFTICNLSLRRNNKTPMAKRFGSTVIEVLDENGQATPARMGIYDSSGRLPLPSNEAVPVRDLNQTTRVVALRLHASPWPVKNRSVFYTNGRYHARLPVGEYELIVAKGPEYRFARQPFAITVNKTTPVKVKLQRWADMAAKGWYSGEDHIHYPRESERDDRNLQLFTQAEDLRVASILEMGNIVTTYFPHYDWKPVVTGGKAPFALVPGQENPRTSIRGHTIQLNIRERVRSPANYLLYHDVFEKVHAQAGLNGYAHVVDNEWHLNAARGMAIDVPFGLVDFAEILSLHNVGAAVWFDFLNLGYKISPSAGTDYPFGDVPGAVRNYVKIDKPFTPQAWFDGLKQGHTFVTSGPMLELSINGQGMGSELHVRRGEPLAIKAKASINPDIDVLSGLELIEQGEPVKVMTSQGGAPEMDLHYDFPAKRGTWFVVRARGKNTNVLALSAPIYVLVDGQSFWKPFEVPSIVARLKQHMQELLGPNQLESIEAWETREPGAKYWDAQQDLLKERVNQANALYDDLARRAAASLTDRDFQGHRPRD